MPGGILFTCSRCGAVHADLPLSFGADAPAYYYAIPEEERARRCRLSDDLCVIDDEHFFIRGCLEIPVRDGPGPFVWGLWTTLSRANYERAVARWNAEGREREPAYFGWLATELPLYPATVNLKTRVHTRPAGQRPWVELEPTDHPLAVEQRTGITMARVQAIAEALLHSDEGD